MRKLALVALVAGCGLYLPGNADDVCQGGVLIAATTLRDPQTGACQAFPNGVGCGCGQICDPPTQTPDWGMCNSACDALDEATCQATSACRAAYTETTASGPGGSGTMTAHHFRGCWATAPSGPIEGGDCTLLDAQACSRHDDCAAIYVDHLGPTDQVASTTFGRCIAESPPPDPCETVATEPACKLRGDCVPTYAGTDCTCTPTTCTCAIETYERCEPAPAP